MKEIAIVTGASRGIGKDVAELFKIKSVPVISTSRNGGNLDWNGEHCLEFPLDLLDSTSIKSFVAFVKSNNLRVKYLVNNSGFLVNKPFEQLTTDDFKKCYGVNVLGVAELISGLMPLFHPNAHTITIGSMGGVQGALKFSGLSAYSSSKMALAGLTECLQEEFGEKGYTFNYLALGSVQTEMLEEAFPGFKAAVTPKQMAKYIVEFALSGDEFIRGKIIPVSKTTP